MADQSTVISLRTACPPYAGLDLIWGFYCQNFQAGCDINKTNEPGGCMHSVISALWFKSIIIIIKKCRSFFAQVHILQQFSLLHQQTKTLPHERGCGRGALSGTLHNFVCFCRRQYSKLSTQRITFVPHENLMVILGAGVVMALCQLLLDVAKELLIACTCHLKEMCTDGMRRDITFR